MKKLEEFFNKNWFTIMGASVGIGGAFGLGENMVHGNWTKIIVGFSVGLILGKILELIIKNSIKRSNSKASR